MKQCQYWDLFADGEAQSQFSKRERVILTHPSAMCGKCVKCLNRKGQGEAAAKRFNVRW